MIVKGLLIIAVGVNFSMGSYLHVCGQYNRANYYMQSAVLIMLMLLALK